MSVAILIGLGALGVLELAIAAFALVRLRRALKPAAKKLDKRLERLERLGKKLYARAAAAPKRDRELSPTEEQFMADIATELGMGNPQNPARSLAGVPRMNASETGHNGAAQHDGVS